MNRDETNKLAGDLAGQERIRSNDYEIKYISFRDDTDGRRIFRCPKCNYELQVSLVDAKQDPLIIPKVMAQLREHTRKHLQARRALQRKLNQAGKWMEPQHDETKN